MLRQRKSPPAARWATREGSTNPSPLLPLNGFLVVYLKKQYAGQKPAVKKAKEKSQRALARPDQPNSIHSLRGIAAIGYPGPSQKG